MGKMTFFLLFDASALEVCIWKNPFQTVPFRILDFHEKPICGLDRTNLEEDKFFFYNKGRSMESISADCVYCQDVQE